MMHEESNSFVLGKEDTNVAICTFWTLAKSVSERLSAESFSICDNLYSTEGINTVLRGILFNPNIRYLFLFGSDLTHSGDNIQKFFEKGGKKNYNC